MWGAQAPQIWARGASQIFIFSCQMGAALPEGERNRVFLSILDRVKSRESGCFASLYSNTVLDGSVKHFPVVKFQKQAHILNPHGTGHVFKTIWGAGGARNFFIHFFIAAEGGVS